MSSNSTKFYIDGAWVDPVVPNFRDIINPATEKVVGRISGGSLADVDLAVIAARRAFPSYSRTTIAERIDLLSQIIVVAEKRIPELADAMTSEMGSPVSFCHDVQIYRMMENFHEMITTLRKYDFEYVMDGSVIRREPIGVCGLISPWNWPLASVINKLGTALAAGCTSIVKPSEFAPLSVVLLAEVLHEAGVPKGAFNLINGEGSVVGDAIARHPGIDMVSFTGSTRAGILVAKSAADSVKRVVQELGGKSANIILPDADLEMAVPAGIHRSFMNSGQSCQAPTRMLVHRSHRQATIDLARRYVDQNVRVGAPLNAQTTMGPLVNKAQFDRVQGLIKTGIREGATLVTGGPGRPEGLNRGYFVRPTIFADVTPEMTIATEEIFGPVLSVLFYDTEDEAIEIANGTTYGLSGYVYSGDIDKAKQVGERLQAGRVYLNNAFPVHSAPFGGYKRSGNGRQQGVFGLNEFLEVKAIIGYAKS